MRRLEVGKCFACGVESYGFVVGGKHICRPCSAVRFANRILRPHGISLLSWQEDVLRALFASGEGGKRLRSRAYISVAKKNGKTWLAGIVGLYHLLFEADLEDSPLEVYSCAASRDQASIVWRSALALLRPWQSELPQLRVKESYRRIERADGRGVWAAVSADGYVHDGVQPSMVIMDELHRWRSGRSATLYDVMTRGTLSRRDPLVVAITTAGEYGDSLLWEREYEWARSVASGALDAPGAYVAIWSADERRVRSEDGYWESLEARLAANPSHELHGGYLRDSAFSDLLIRARNDQLERKAYIRYHLNVPLTESESGVIDMVAWSECHGGVDLRAWDRYDVERLSAIWGLRDRPCWLGVDLSQVVDITALAAVFPPYESDDLWRVLVWCWIPRETVRRGIWSDQVPWDAWIEAGYVECTEGAVVDVRAVLDQIEWCRRTYDVQQVCIDPWNARDVAAELMDRGYEVVEVPQNFARLSGPTKRFLELVAGRKLAHGNNPVLTWFAGNLELRRDHKDNVMPDKPPRNKTSKRIDGISAIVTAMYRAGSVTSSVYDERGIVVL